MIYLSEFCIFNSLDLKPDGVISLSCVYDMLYYESYMFQFVLETPYTSAFKIHNPFRTIAQLCLDVCLFIRTNVCQIATNRIYVH